MARGWCWVFPPKLGIWHNWLPLESTPYLQWFVATTPKENSIIEIIAHTISHYFPISFNTLYTFFFFHLVAVSSLSLGWLICDFTQLRALSHQSWMACLPPHRDSFPVVEYLEKVATNYPDEWEAIGLANFSVWNIKYFELCGGWWNRLESTFNPL